VLVAEGFSFTFLLLICQTHCFAMENGTVKILSTEREECSAEITSKRKHPHAQRRSEIMSKHPEIASLVGTNKLSFVYTILLVAFQMYSAVVITKYLSWPFSLILAYTLAAIIDHSLWVLIHDATHNLVFRSITLNRITLLIANIPHIFPSAMLFRYYHILHHIELNKIDKDPDVPADWEAKFVGNSAFRKGLWLAFFFFFQSLRVLFYAYRVPSGKELLWVGCNWLMCVLPSLFIYKSFGISPILYLTFASICSIGLHPLGARWIQEHYPTHPFQSTYSYYGIANRVAFNIGFHNEHHDFPSIPWSNLPLLKKLAPEYYDTLFAYSSYTQLLFDFILERRWSLLVRWESEMEHLKKDS